MRWSPFSAMNPAAVGQQTLVGRVIASGQTMRGSKSAAPKRRRKASRKTASRKQRASPAKRKSTRARLVKGSAAAKAYMAKIRRKRRK
jgi:hypothetical protein